MNISIIIPTYNEAEGIHQLVKFLHQNGSEAVKEVIVSDGGSTDETIKQAEKAGAMAVISEVKGRAGQMNHGATLATGDVLYFVHADSFPPKTFANDIIKAIDNGADLGRYRTKFQSKSILLKLNAFFTRFDLFMCMGGDQTLFIKKELFQKAKGFRQDMHIMEEYEFCNRVRQTAKYTILPGAARISARKYETNGWLRVQRANATVISMYKNGASQQDMIDTYKKMLSYRSNAF